MNKVETTPQVKKILLAIKNILRNKKITYDILANGIGMSESGIKKIFTAKDCSFKRIITICNFLNININEVIKYSEMHSPKKNRFSPKVEKFFIKNVDYLMIFFKLVSDNLSARELMEKEKISERSMQKYLLKLEQMDLLKFYSLDKVILPPIDFFELEDAGEMIRLIRILSCEDMLNETFLSDIENKDDSYSILNFKLTENSYKALSEDLFGLDAKYNTRSNYEREIYDLNEMIDVSFIFGLINEPFYKKIE